MPNYIGAVEAVATRAAASFENKAAARLSTEALESASRGLFVEARATVSKLVDGLLAKGEETLASKAPQPNNFVAYMDNPSFPDKFCTAAKRLDGLLERPATVPIFDNYHQLFRPFTSRTNPGYLDGSYNTVCTNATTRADVLQQLRHLSTSTAEVPASWRPILQDFERLYQRPPVDVADWVRFERPMLKHLHAMSGPNVAWAHIEDQTTRRLAALVPFGGTSEAVATTRFAHKIMSGADVRTAKSAMGHLHADHITMVANQFGSGSTRPLTSPTLRADLASIVREGWRNRIATTEKNAMDALTTRKLLETHVPALKNAGVH
jgi:hypothetical protein